MKLVLAVNLPLELLSLNGIKGRHWGAWKKLKKHAAEALLEARVTARKDTPSTRQRVVITRFMKPRQRPFDHENFTGGAKALVDALTDLGYWRDDSERFLEREYHQAPATVEHYRRGLLTRVAIFDLGVEA